MTNNNNHTKAEELAELRQAADMQGLSQEFAELEAERDALQRKVQEMALQALADDTQSRELSAALAQRREPLTDDDAYKIAAEYFNQSWYRRVATEVVRATERAHGIGATTGEQHEHPDRQRTSPRKVDARRR